MKLMNTIKTLYIRVLFIGVIVLVSVNLNAQEFKKTATAGFTFLELPASARTAALGEASIALSDINSDAVFQNPAALGYSNQKHSFSVSYAPWLADIKHYTMSYSYESPYGIIGIGVIMLDYGSMPRTTVGGGQKVFNILGDFNANSLAVGLSYSRRLTDKFSFGVTLKYAEEKIDIYKASNILFDGGVLYYTGLSSLRIAMSIQNFGVDAKFINDEFKMPSVLRLGAAMELFGDMESEYRVTLVMEALHPNDTDERLNIGGEVSWLNMITFRGGYKFFCDEESYSAGFGINPKLSYPINFDFAYSDYGRLGDVSRFTIQLGVL
ncbi:MAG: PorV/PorQ family protein [Melioribacteraceae bacterium]|nr:PorV/PorQ family protein [Melioribacteraceae bacterium]